MSPNNERIDELLKQLYLFVENPNNVELQTKLGFLGINRKIEETKESFDELVRLMKRDYEERKIALSHSVATKKNGNTHGRALEKSKNNVIVHRANIVLIKRLLKWLENPETSYYFEKHRPLFTNKSKEVFGIIFEEEIVPELKKLSWYHPADYLITTVANSFALLCTQTILSAYPCKPLTPLGG